MTLELKSGPAPKTSKTEYLSTMATGKLNPEEVLAQFGSRPVILAAIQVTPRIGSTGQREERGAWIHKIWSAALTAMPDLQGCRMGWDSVFFVTDDTDLENIKQPFRQAHCSVRDPGLKSWCIVSEALGSPDEKGRLLYHDMQHDLTASREICRFPHRLIDGMDEQDT